jgi:hypothetical protein
VSIQRLNTYETTEERSGTDTFVTKVHASENPRMCVCVWGGGGGIQQTFQATRPTVPASATRTTTTMTAVVVLSSDDEPDPVLTVGATVGAGVGFAEPDDDAAVVAVAVAVALLASV